MIHWKYTYLLVQCLSLGDCCLHVGHLDINIFNTHFRMYKINKISHFSTFQLVIRWLISYFSTNQSLIIMEVRSEDSGKYTCVAKSKSGQFLRHTTRLPCIFKNRLEVQYFCKGYKVSRHPYLPILLSGITCPVT